MGKTLLLLSLVVLTVLFLGTSLAPQDPAFWLASSVPTYQHIREVLALVLMLQLITRPPRHVWFRMLAGAIAVAVGSWSIEATYSYSMQLLDTLCFIGAAVAIGITALERRAITPSTVLLNKGVLA